MTAFDIIATASRRRAGLMALAAATLTTAWAFGAPGFPAHAAGVQATIYVSPSGDDANPGTQAQPLQTVQKAQQLVRGMSSSMSGDIDVVLEDGFYRMTAPLTLTPADSGTNGHNVVWTADNGARPVLAGSDQITGWKLYDSARNIWVAQGPSGIQTRQLYVDGARAAVASGTIPVGLTKTGSGYTASAATMAGWRDPSGQAPSDVELRYTGTGPDDWNESVCPIASMSGTTVTMGQPCWADSNSRGTNHVGGGSFKAPTSIENAYALLTQPGQWYLDSGNSRFYYMPLAGQDITKADVEAPVLQNLVDDTGVGPTSPLQNVVFNGIQFSYATWIWPAGYGFSDVQANEIVWGLPANQGNCQFGGTCPYGAWYQIPADVTLSYSHNVQFTNDAFLHLGAAGLGLGDGSQNDVVKGNVVTDTSGNGIELGKTDMPLATGGDQTINNTIQDNHVFNTPVEFRGGIGIDVGYAANTLIDHNQIDHTPYSAMSNGWGGWPDKVAQPGQANFAHGNTISNNLVFDFLEVLNDGGGTYNNGIQGTSYATGEHIVNNIFHDDLSKAGTFGHVIYVDDGTAWITISGNCVYNNGAHSPEGRSTPNYYPGVPGATDPISVTGNFFVTSAAGCPASLVASAGLEPAYQGLLSWTQAPNPPVGGGPPPPVCGTPTNPTATVNGGGAVTVMWTPAGSGCTAYAVWAYSPSVAGQFFETSGQATVVASGLTPGDYYTFTVIGFDGSQWVAWSGYTSYVLVA